MSPGLGRPPARPDRRGLASHLFDLGAKAFAAVGALLLRVYAQVVEFRRCRYFVEEFAIRVAPYLVGRTELNGKGDGGIIRSTPPSDGALVSP